jgi:UDP-N-acetyl-D-mannosaminuronic acid transferase (WecB/TagA/CpsF family)
MTDLSDDTERLIATTEEEVPASVRSRLIAKLRNELPCAWWLGVGISFSFLNGSVRRAPGWMQRVGLEWLHRLGQEPARLARRYLLDGIPFALRLLIHSAAHSQLAVLKQRGT